MTAADRIGGSQGYAIVSAARLAFADANGLVLMLSGILIALLAVSVLWELRNADVSVARSQ